MYTENFLEIGPKVSSIFQSHTDTVRFQETRGKDIRCRNGMSMLAGQMHVRPEGQAGNMGEHRTSEQRSRAWKAITH